MLDLAGVWELTARPNDATESVLPIVVVGSSVRLETPGYHLPQKVLVVEKSKGKRSFTIFAHMAFRLIFRFYFCAAQVTPLTYPIYFS